MSGALDDFLSKAVSDCVNGSTVAQPRYTRQEHQARVKAWQTIAYHGDGTVISFGTLNEAIDAYLESLRKHSAAEDVR